jgi:hypothetical protein
MVMVTMVVVIGGDGYHCTGYDGDSIVVIDVDDDACNTNLKHNVNKIYTYFSPT